MHLDVDIDHMKLIYHFAEAVQRAMNVCMNSYNLYLFGFHEHIGITQNNVPNISVI